MLEMTSVMDPTCSESRSSSWIRSAEVPTTAPTCSISLRARSTTAATARARCSVCSATCAVPAALSDMRCNSSAMRIWRVAASWTSTADPLELAAIC